MSSAYWINLGMFIATFTFSIILFIGAFMGRRLKGGVFRWFFYMVIAYVVTMAFSGIIWLFEGTPGNTIRIICKIADYMMNMSATVGYIFFSLYVCDYLSIKSKQTRKPVYAITAFCVPTLTLSTISLFNNSMTWFDQNNYFHVTDHFWMMYAGPFISVIIIIQLILRHIKILKPSEYITLLTYIIIPLTCFTLDNFMDIWVGVLSMLIVLSLVYITIQVDLMKKIEEQNTLLAESRIAVMLSQIQPHFLYNSLTAIHALCEEDPKTAKEMVSEFAVYLRGNLDSLLVKKPIPFEQELKHVETYLALEKKRFGDKLKVKYEISARDFVLPALTLQPVVENAVRHGVTKRSKGGTVTICTQESETAYLITVTDDGIGFNVNDKLANGISHIGIENVRSRLESMCGGSLEIQSKPDIGTTAVITIPKGNII